MSERLTGQDIQVQLFKGDVLQDQLGLVKECTASFEMSVSREDYLGMNQQLPDGKFDILKIEFASHQDSAAWFDFVNAIVDKQMRLPGAPTSINVSLNLLWPNGQARSIVAEGLEFETITVTAGMRKDMIENGFTCYATRHQFVN